jgi:hypothetical protein
MLGVDVTQKVGFEDFLQRRPVEEVVGLQSVGQRDAGLTDVALGLANRRYSLCAGQLRMMDSSGLRANPGKRKKCSKTFCLA